MKKFRLLITLVTIVCLLGVLAACTGGGNAGGNANSEGNGANTDTQTPPTTTDPEPELKPDTITALLPPVSANFQSWFEDMEKEFNELYPNLTLEIEPAGWEDITSKLDTQVNAGDPPDIAFIGSGSIPKYLDLGMLMDISDVAADAIADFDEVPLGYMKNGDGLYGLPAYMVVHAIGGNREFLEQAGIDWQTVQQNGWSYEEFREAIKAGIVTENGVTKRYGFVFATSGVTSRDYLTMLAQNAGMPYAFDEELKYTYTSQNFLGVLQAVREMIDDGSMPKELSSIDAGKRWNMFLTGQTMITGKGLATFENSANVNNEKLAAGDGSAVEGSIPTEYIHLPMPTFFGAEPASTTVIDGYVTFRGKDEPTEEHKANVVKAAHYLASGKWAAMVNEELFTGHITQSARDYAANNPNIVKERNPHNVAANDRMMEDALPARPDIPANLAADVIKLENEVIIPLFQALLADEVTPEDMYEQVKAEAIRVFGEDGVVAD